MRARLSAMPPIGVPPGIRARVRRGPPYVSRRAPHLARYGGIL